jgi:hypothetical protein
MDVYPLGPRVTFSQIAGCGLLAAGVLFGPVDTIPRALVVGACAGCAASALAGMRFPGWAWFSAGLACSAAGLLRQQWGLEQWALQLLLCCCCVLAYTTVWPVAQATLMYVFNVEMQDYHEPYAEAEEEPALSWLLRGLYVTLLASLGTTIGLLLLGPASQWFGGPAWLLLSFWLGSAFTGLRPEWLLGGVLFGLCLLLGLAGLNLAPLVLPCLLVNDSYWLVGQALAWSTLGHWLSLWQQGPLPPRS